MIDKKDITACGVPEGPLADIAMELADAHPDNVPKLFVLGHIESVAETPNRLFISLLLTFALAGLLCSPVAAQSEGGGLFEQSDPLERNTDAWKAPQDTPWGWPQQTAPGLSEPSEEAERPDADASDIAGSGASSVQRYSWDVKPMAKNECNSDGSGCEDNEVCCFAGESGNRKCRSSCNAAGQTPVVPVDQNLIFLIVAGIGYGVYRLRIV